MSDSLKKDSGVAVLRDIWGILGQILRTVFMSKEIFRLIVVGIIALLMLFVPPIAVQATVGW